MVEQRVSYCRNCSARCGVTLDVDGPKIISVSPDRDNPYTKGFFCIKGEMAADLIRGAEARVEAPLKRLATGAFEPISADAALDEIAEALRHIIDQHGPDAFALYYGTAAYSKTWAAAFGGQFVRALGSPNLFSTMSIDQTSQWVTECRMGVFATGRPHADDVDALMIAGSNPVVSHAGKFFALPATQQLRYIKALKARAGSLIVVDPRATETARHADIFLQPKPGFDAEIFASLIHIILENGWEDSAFCQRYVTNLSELRRAVAPFDPATVAALAGLDAARLVEAARVFSQARRPDAGFGTGVSMSASPNTAAHMIYALSAICGGYARVGDRLYNPGHFSPRPRTEGVTPPNRTWERGPKLRSGHGQIYGEFPSTRLVDEILNPGPKKIRALIVMGGNPVMAFGEPDRVVEALKDLDLLVVIDPRMTETAALAHYVVAPKLPYESSDFTLMHDGSFTSPFIQVTHPAVPAPDEAIEEWDFLNRLAHRFGQSLSVELKHPDGVKRLTLTPDRTWSFEDLARWTFEMSGISYEETVAHPHGWAREAADIRVEAPQSDDGLRLDVCPPDVAQELAGLKHAAPLPGFTFTLTCRRIIETFNSAFRASPITHRRHDTNPLYMHPEDMADAGLEADSTVAVSSAHGRIRVKVTPDRTMRRGVVSITHGWGSLGPGADAAEAARGASVNELISFREGHTEVIDGMPRLSALPVRIDALPTAAMTDP